MTDNLLYYGDNLDVLRRHVKDDPGAPGLVYLDPPSFNRKPQACAEVDRMTSNAHACTATPPPAITSWTRCLLSPRSPGRRNS